MKDITSVLQEEFNAGIRLFNRWAYALTAHLNKGNKQKNQNLKCVTLRNTNKKILK